MIFSDRFLFLHMPKTAGKSLSVALTKAWGGNVTAYVSRGQVADLAPVIADGATLFVGNGHQTAAQTDEILRTRHNRNLASFEAVFLPVRNPYTRFFSTYYFLRGMYEKGNRTHPMAQIAGTSNTPLDFARNTPSGDFTKWISLDGVTPLPNLRFLRFEKLAEDLAKHSSELGLPAVELPFINKGDVDNYDDQLTPELEDIISEKYISFFALGLYPRRTTPKQEKRSQ